jgi:hypothetical protein
MPLAAKALRAEDGESMREKLRFLIGLAACAAVFANGPSLFAQVDDPNTRATQEEFAGGGEGWGTTSDIIYNVGADDFSVRLLGWTNAQLFNNAEIQPANAGTIDISGPIHLQAGASVKSITVFYTDNNTTADPSGNFWRASTTGGLTNIQTITFPAGFSGGNNNFTVTLPAPGVTIDNLTNHYSVNFSLTRSSTTTTQFHGMYRARITYRLQVSPAPAVATFADVPTTDLRFRFVEALVASGLTGGCGGGNYCPNDPVTRGQIAVFLASALGMHFPN